MLLGGGQEAMSVTTTAGKVGKFDARFHHLVFEEELGRVKGHFGPINTVAFHPDGKGLVNQHTHKKEEKEEEEEEREREEKRPDFLLICCCYCCQVC